MRKILQSIVLLVLLALAALAPARAQNIGVSQCGGFDTTVSGDTAAKAVLQLCNVTTGPNGIIYAIAVAEVTCGATESAQMFVASGTSPVNGSNFIGSATGGVLTVTSLIPGIGTLGNPWYIQTGQILVPSFSNFAPTAITGQTSQATYSVTGSIAGTTMNVTAVGSGAIVQGATVTGAVVTPGTTIVSGPASGGTGTYTVSVSQTVGSTTLAGTNPLGTLGTYTVANGSLSVASTNLYTLNALPGGMTAMTQNMQQTACNSGFTITSIAGSFVGAPNTAYWLDVAISTSNGASQATWNNNGITVLTY